MARRYRFIAFLFALLAQALAAPAAADSDGPANSLTRGASAIQFQTFGGDFGTPFRSTGIYLKHHLSDRSAVRAGVDFDFDESMGESPPGTYEPGLENIDSYSIVVSAEWTRYLDTSGPTAVFLGFGPYWERRGYTSEYQSTSINGTTVYTNHSKQENRIWTIGGSASLGFEWFFTRKLSLLGRVGASAGIGEQHRINRYESTNGPSASSSTWRLDSDTATAGTSSAAVGLSAYF